MSEWNAHVRYHGSLGWFAEVYRGDAPRPFASRSCFTEGGARRVGRRLADQLARLEREGKLDYRGSRV